MESASSNAGTPAQEKYSPERRQPRVFEWYENRVEEGLRTLYKEDISQRQVILAIISEMNDSNLFAELLVKLEDAMDHAKKTGAHGDDELIAFAARVYIAGAHRGCTVLNV